MKTTSKRAKATSPKRRGLSGEEAQCYARIESLTFAWEVVELLKLLAVPSTMDALPAEVRGHLANLGRYFV